MLRSRVALRAFYVRHLVRQTKIRLNFLRATDIISTSRTTPAATAAYLNSKLYRSCEGDCDVGTNRFRSKQHRRACPLLDLPGTYEASCQLVPPLQHDTPNCFGENDRREFCFAPTCSGHIGRCSGQFGTSPPGAIKLMAIEARFPAASTSGRIRLI